MNENQKTILPIIEVIILSELQDLALRGHSPYGKINVNPTQITNKGNFRELLKYRARGDS